MAIAHHAPFEHSCEMQPQRAFTTRDHTFETICIGLLFFALMSMFVEFSIPLAGLKVRLADLLILSVCPLLLCFGRVRPVVSLPLLVVILYTGYVGFSGFRLGVSNGMRETLQAGEIILFSAVLATYYRAIHWPAALRYFLVLAGAILSYCIIWHVAHGYYAGWKQLGAAKLLFTFFPLVAFVFWLIRPRKIRIIDLLMLVGLGFIVLQSGERKALIFYLICFASLFVAGKLRLSGAALVLVVAVAGGAGLLSTNDYVQRQLDASVSFATQSSAYKTAAEDFVIGSGTENSLSNAQRKFAEFVSKTIDHDHILTGVGTNGYARYISEHYPFLPPYLQVAIHNEFQRARTENGLIGIALYLVPWLRAACTIAAGFVVARSTSAPGPLSGLIILCGLFLQCRFESSGLHSLLAFVFVAFLPDLTALIKTYGEADVGSFAAKMSGFPWGSAADIGVK
jgi:hypothetical protein